MDAITQAEMSVEIGAGFRYSNVWKYSWCDEMIQFVRLVFMQLFLGKKCALKIALC